MQPAHERARGVVVTGMGAVGWFGVGLEALDAALARGAPALSEVDQSGGMHEPGAARMAGLIDPDALKPHLPPGAARRMSLPSQMAVVAALGAVEQAGLADAAYEGVGVCLGSAFGPSSFMARILAQIHGPGPRSVSPFLFMESVANVMAGQVALALNASGPNATITQRETSALLALARGKALIQSGRCERVVVGSVDEISPIIHAALDRFGALARPDAGGTECARVFDAERSGYVACDGGTVLVLEEEAAARARGARPIARVGAVVRANDPTAPAANWGSGADALGDLLARRLAEQGVDLADVDRLVSGASGSTRGDQLDGRVFQRLFGERPLPELFAPKAYTGEVGGGFLAATLRSFTTTIPGPTPGFRRADGALALTPSQAPELAPPARALVSSLAPGGSSAWVVLENLA